MDSFFHFLHTYSRTPRLATFSGSPADDYEQWEEEAQRILTNFSMDPGTVTEWLIQSLAGLAREEILQRGLLDTTNILKCLRDTFADTRSLSALLETFHSKRQTDGEGLLRYSNNLEQLYRRINQRCPNTLSSSALRDRLVNGIRKEELRREMLKWVRQTPEATFLQVRAEALHWERGLPTGSGLRRSPTPCFKCCSRGQGEPTHRTSV